jgi:uncharacterized protein
MDWRRRIAALYAEVRAGGPGWGTCAAFRAARDALYAEHPQSPIPREERDGFEGVPWYEHREDMRVEAFLDPDPEGAELLLPISVGEPVRFTRLGFVQPEIAGTPVRLAVYWLEGYGGGLFLPFRDAGAGTETYGAGRYLLDTVKGADLGMSHDGERLVLDFNYAYNPSCSYDARWSCPLAPAENRLDIAIPAGERLA